MYSRSVLFRHNLLKRPHFASSISQQTIMANVLKPSEAHALLFPTGDAQKPNSVYLDVRMPDEFKDGHVPEAINVPVTMGGMKVEPSFVDTVKEKIEGGKHIIVGCKSGKRSSMAINVLLSNGFDATRLTNLDGGFDAWKSTKGLPTE